MQRRRFIKAALAVMGGLFAPKAVAKAEKAEMVPGGKLYEVKMTLSTGEMQLVGLCLGDDIPKSMDGEVCLSPEDDSVTARSSVSYARVIELAEAERQAFLGRRRSFLDAWSGRSDEECVKAWLFDVA